MVAEDVARRFDSAEGRVPPELLGAMRDACLEGGLAQRALLAPAAARFCGADPADALPAAASVTMLSGAVGCHLGLEGMPLAGTSAGDICRKHGPVLAILAGDALVPMAMGVLAAECGRHSVMLVSAASVAMGTTGVLGSASLLAGGSTSGDLPPELEDDQGHMGLSPLARFAAWGGALLAGAAREMADDCALAGLHAGRALDVLESDGPGPDRVFEARSELDRARELVGTGQRADLFAAVIDAVGRHFPSRSDELFFRTAPPGDGV